MKNSLQQWIAAILITSTVVVSSGCASSSGSDAHSFRLRAHSQALSDTTEEDVKAEINFGRDVAGRILGRFALLKDEQQTHYVNLIGTALASQAGRGELNFYFAILDSDSINAYSAPGGYIFITKGALLLAEDEAELAAILAHEIAHVSERHIVNALNIRASDNSSAAGMGRMLSAGSDTARVAFMQALDQAVAILFESGYSQQDELDADRVATLLLVNSGFDPLALRRYLGRAQGAANETQTINVTHPPSQQRLASLDQLIADEALNELDLARNTTRFNHYVKNQ